MRIFLKQTKIIFLLSSMNLTWCVTCILHCIAAWISWLEEFRVKNNFYQKKLLDFKNFWERFGRRTANPTGQNVKQCVPKLLSKNRDDPTVQSPGIAETAGCDFPENFCENSCLFFPSFVFFRLYKSSIKPCFSSRSESTMCSDTT